MNTNAAQQLIPSALIAACAMMIACSSQANISSAQGSAAHPSEGHAAKSSLGEIAWFQGAGALPESHPCHDSSPVVRARMTEDAARWKAGDLWNFKMSTLGELSKAAKDDDGMYLGPRIVRGLRWTDATGEYLVTACNMGGAGFGELAASLREKEERLSGVGEGAEIIIGYSNEPIMVQRGALRWMRRAENGRWQSLNHRVLWRANNEGFNPHLAAFTGLIAAEDADGNGRPEVVVFSIRDTETSDANTARILCPEAAPEDTCLFFEMNIIAREGEHELIERLSLPLGASTAGFQEVERPGSMSAEAFSTLAAAIDTHRSAAIEQAWEAVQGTKKLADTP